MALSPSRARNQSIAHSRLRTELSLQRPTAEPRYRYGDAAAGAGVGAAVGGLTDGLVGIGIPEYEAKRYEGKIKEGNILISVHSENSDEVKRAKDIFERAARTASRISKKRAFPSRKKSAFRSRLLRVRGLEGRTRNCFRRNYEDFIEDHKKRDGRDGLGLTLGIRRSHPDITRAVHGARLHIIRNSCALIADPCSDRK